MSDKDLIRRGDVYEAIYALHADGKEGIMNAPRNSYGEDLRDVIDAIGDIPAVPQEMSAREYERAIDRAFYSADDAWGEWADAIDEGNKDKAVTIIEKWTREHPERSEDDAKI